MEFFVYNLAKPREDIQSFNHRLQQYCADNDVIQAESSFVGPSLVVALTVMENIQLPAANTVSVEVHLVDGHSDDLEEQLSKVLDDMAERDTEEDPVLPFQARIHPRPDLCTQGAIVIQLFTGTVVDTSLGDDDVE